MKDKLIFPLLSLAFVFLFACEKDQMMESVEADADVAASSLSKQSNSLKKEEAEFAGAVFTMSNSISGNSILAYNRTADGALEYIDEYPTRGFGTGAGLGSQGALILYKNQYLLAVNAGSNDMSALRITPNGLKFLAKVKTGGKMPVSLTAHKNMVYVLNAGDEDTPSNVTGFRFDNDGSMFPINTYTRPLSDAMTGPAQIEFTPDGYQLIVTEKGTNQILTYNINEYGEPGFPVVNASSGMTPFGFTFDKQGKLYVSEAFGGTASAVSSYSVQEDGMLSTITPSEMAPGEQAACWIILSKDDRYAYTTNTATNSISSFSISDAGIVTLSGAEAGMTGAGPIDMAFSDDSKYLYTLNAGDATISAFMTEEDGTLVPLSGIDNGIPAGAVGLAAR